MSTSSRSSTGGLLLSEGSLTTVRGEPHAVPPGPSSAASAWPGPWDRPSPAGPAAGRPGGLGRSPRLGGSVRLRRTVRLSRPVFLVRSVLLCRSVRLGGRIGRRPGAPGAPCPLGGARLGFRRGRCLLVSGPADPPPPASVRPAGPSSLDLPSRLARSSGVASWSARVTTSHWTVAERHAAPGQPRRRPYGRGVHVGGRPDLGEPRAAARALPHEAGTSKYQRPPSQCRSPGRNFGRVPVTGSRKNAASRTAPSTQYCSSPRVTGPCSSRRLAAAVGLQPAQRGLRHPSPRGQQPFDAGRLGALHVRRRAPRRGRRCRPCRRGARRWTVRGRGRPAACRAAACVTPAAGRRGPQAIARQGEVRTFQVEAHVDDQRALEQGVQHPEQMVTLGPW